MREIREMWGVKNMDMVPVQKVEFDRPGERSPE